MPAAKPATGKKTQRAPQCVYTEDNRRCRRSGTGDPALCHPHMIAFAETAKAAEPKKFGEGIADLFDRVIHGKKINRKVLENVADDVMWWATARGTPQPQAEASRGPGPSPGGRPPPPRWPPNGFPWHAPPRPPVDPRIAEQKRARLRARTTLGFTPTEQLTAEIIKERRREYAIQYHPDKVGGNLGKMQQVNDAADVLLASL